jgi:hypothetical protein
VRVGHLHAEALKEPLIDDVEEGLLLVEVGDGGGGVFDGAVEVLEALAEIVAAEYAGVERRNNLFDLLGNDIALDEIGVGEDFAEDALGNPSGGTSRRRIAQSGRRACAPTLPYVFQSSATCRKRSSGLSGLPQRNPS